MALRTLILLSLLAVIGCSSPKMRVVAPPEYRDQFAGALNHASACSGVALKKRDYRLNAYAGTRRVNGAWQAPMPPNGNMQWGITINGVCHVAFDPRTHAMDPQILGHEALHAVLHAHGVGGHPVAYRHCAVWWQDSSRLHDVSDGGGCWFDFSGETGE